MTGSPLPKPAPDMLMRELTRGLLPSALSMCHRPGAVVLVDDDPAFLEMMQVAAPPAWQLRTFSHPSGCVAALKREVEEAEQDLWKQQEVAKLAIVGASVIPLVLRYFLLASTRRSLVRVALVDYAMPAYSGLYLLREVADWPGLRVLLSGTADETVATVAFNARLIDRYIAKQVPDIGRQIVAAVDELISSPDARHQQLWLGTLAREQAELLRDTAASAQLGAFLHANFVEWIIAGQPFGAVALDAAGRAFWVQLADAAHAGPLADAAMAAGLSASEVAAIRSGHALCDVELRRCVALRGATLAPAVRLGGAEGMLAAIHPVGDEIMEIIARARHPLFG